MGLDKCKIYGILCTRKEIFMIVNRKDFMKALTSVFPIMGKGEQNTVTNNFAFFKDDEGNSYIGTTNNEVAIVKPLTFSVDAEFRVPGTKLFQVLKKLTKAKELDIEYSGTYITIKSDIDTETCIQTVDSAVNLLDHITSIPDEDFKELPDNFSEALTECSRYATTDNAHNLLQYIYAEGSKMVSASLREIVLCKLNSKVDKMFISARDASILKGIKLKDYAFDDNLLYFRTEEGAYIAVQPASNKERYPVVITPADYTEEELEGSMKPFLVKNLFSLEDLREVEFSKNVGKEVVDVLRTCAMFTEEGKSGVRCEFDKNTLTITGQDKTGMHKQTVMLDGYVSNRFVFETHPQLLIDIIERKDVFYVSKEKGKAIVKNDMLAHLIQIG